MSILIGGALLGLYALLLLACRPRLARGELPLASSWIPWVGQAIEYIRNPRRGLAAWARAYPRGFTLPICGTLLTVFVSQELIQYFFKVRDKLAKNAVLLRFGTRFSQAPFSEVAHLSSKEYVAALMPVVPMSNRPGSDEDNAAVTIFKRYLTPRWMR